MMTQQVRLYSLIFRGVSHTNVSQANDEDREIYEKRKKMATARYLARIRLIKDWIEVQTEQPLGNTQSLCNLIIFC